MAEQDILFLLSGDAQGAVDALVSLIDVVKQLDQALQGLAGSLSVLNEVEAALAAMGSDEAGVLATSTAVGDLGTAISTASGGLPALEEGLAGLAQVEADVEATSANIAQVMSIQAEALVADAQAADAALQSLAGLATGENDVAASNDAMLSSSDAIVASLTAEEVAAGLTAEQVSAFIDVLMQAGGTEIQAAQALDDYVTACQRAVQSQADAASSGTALAATGDAIAASFVPATEAETLQAIALANLGSEMVSFVEQSAGMGQAEADISSNAASSATDLDLLRAVVEQLYVALGEAGATVGSVASTLTELVGAGVDAEMAMAALEQVAGALGVNFADLQVSMSGVLTSLGMVAPEADVFTVSFTDAEMATGLFSASLSAIPGQVGAAVASLFELAGASDEVTVASDGKTRALRDQADATQGDAYMILVLLQFLLQAVGGFVQMGTAAQDSIAKLSGLADQSLAGSAGLSKLNGVVSQLEADSIKFGISLTDASNGLYYIMSAGFNTTDSLLILKSSMEASAATGATMTSISSGLTSILNAYGMSASQAATVTNQMVQSIVSGKMNAQDYANAIGNLASVAHQTGFSFIEATSALSTFTQINGRTRQDAQNLAQLFQVLGLRADDTAKAAKGLGLGFNETAYKSMDLQQKLEYLAKVAGGDNTAAFGKLLLNATATRSAFELLSNNGKNLGTVLSAVADSQHALDIAFSESEKTITAASNHMQAALSVLAYQLVVLATPVVTAFFGALTTAIGFLTQHMDVLIPVVTALAVIIGGLLVTALTAMVGMMAPIIAGSIAVFGPLAAIAAIVAVVVMALQHLASVNPLVASAFTTFGMVASSVANTLGTIFNTNIQRAGVLLQQLGGWIQANVIPPLSIITMNLLTFGGYILTYVVPALLSFLGAMQPVGAFIMGTIVPAIGQFVIAALKVGEFISANLVPAFSTLRSILAPLAIVIVGFGAAWAVVAGSGAIAAVVSVVTTAIAIFGFFGASIGTVVVALATMAAAFLAPIAAIAGIIAVVALAVVGFINLYNSSAVVRNNFAILWQEALKLWGILQANLAPVLRDLWAAIQGQLVPAFQQLLTAIQPAMPLLQMLGALLGGVIMVSIILVIGALAGLAAGLGQFLRGAIQTVTGVIQVFTGLIAFFVNFGNLIVAVLTGQWGKVDQITFQMGENLRTIFAGIWNVIVGLTRAFIGTIGAIFGQFVSTVIKIFTDLANQIVGHSIWPDMLNAMLSVLTAWVGQIVSAFTAFISQVISVITTFAAQMTAIFTATWAAIQVIWQTVLAALAALLSGNFARFVALIQQAGAQMQSVMRAAWAAIQSATQAGIANIVAAVQGFVGRLAAIFAGLAAQAFSWGSDFMSQMAAGVASAGAGVVAAAQGIAGKVAGLLHFSLPDEGPLSDADKWMPDFGDLLTSGLNAQVDKVGRAAGNMAMSVQMAAPSPGDIAKYSAPAAPARNDDHIRVLQAILAELQSQRQSGGGRMTIGHQLPNTALGTVTQSFGGGGNRVNAIHDQYQQLNTLAGIAYENGVRGSITGLGV